MSNIVKTEAFDKALIEGNLQSLTSEERITYYKKVCESLGLNPLTKPFEYMVLNGKTVLYASKSCTEQLRSIHSISLQISARDKFDDVYVVTARAKTKDGREDESTGAVNIANLKGEALANAFMKAETKAKRRVTLSICGLAMLDETEVETIPHAKFVEQEIKEISEPGADIKNLSSPDVNKTTSLIKLIGVAAKKNGWQLGDVTSYITATYFKSSKELSPEELTEVLEHVSGPKTEVKEVQQATPEPKFEAPLKGEAFAPEPVMAREPEASPKEKKDLMDAAFDKAMSPKIMNHIAVKGFKMSNVPQKLMPELWGMLNEKQ